jgi:hypothetical protein
MVPFPLTFALTSANGRISKARNVYFWESINTMKIEARRLPEKAINFTGMGLRFKSAQDRSEGMVRTARH